MEYEISKLFYHHYSYTCCFMFVHSFNSFVLTCFSKLPLVTFNRYDSMKSLKNIQIGILKHWLKYLIDYMPHCVAPVIQAKGRTTYNLVIVFLACKLIFKKFEKVLCMQVYTLCKSVNVCAHFEWTLSAIGKWGGGGNKRGKWKEEDFEDRDFWVFVNRGQVETS